LGKIETGSGEEDTYRKLSRDLLDEDLRNWIPRFTLDVEKAANHAAPRASHQGRKDDRGVTYFV
jgi:hypothetical protein